MSKILDQLKQDASIYEQKLNDLRDKDDFHVFARQCRAYNQIVQQLIQFEQAETYLRRVTKHYELALQHITREEDWWLVASMSDDLASLYDKLMFLGDWNRESAQSEYKKILSLHQQAAQLFYDNEHLIGYAGVHINIAGTYSNLARMYPDQEAIEYLYKADEACHVSITYRDAESHARDYAMLQDNHGAIHLELAWLENFEENVALALEAMMESSEIFKRIDALHDHGISEGHLAGVYSDQASKLEGEPRIAKLRQAEQHYRIALEHIDRDKDLTDFAFMTVNLANVLSKLGKDVEGRIDKLKYFKEGVSLYSTALSLMREDANMEGRITAIHNLALLHYDFSKIEDHSYHLERAEANFKRVIQSEFDPFLVMSSYKFLASLYGQLGKRQQVRDAYLILLTMSHEQDLLDNVESITEFLVDTETWIERLMRWIGLAKY